MRDFRTLGEKACDENKTHPLTFLIFTATIALEAKYVYTTGGLEASVEIPLLWNPQVSPTHQTKT